MAALFFGNFLDQFLITFSTLRINIGVFSLTELSISKNILPNDFFNGFKLLSNSLYLAVTSSGPIDLPPTAPRCLSEPPKSKNSIELELAQLKKELLVVNQERDILKKASAYFASQML